MLNNMSRYFIILVIGGLLLAFSTASSADIVGSTDDSTVIGGGARPIGMGRAFVAIADDVDAPFINPAGLASLKGPSAMAMYTNLLSEVYYYEYVGAVPSPIGSFGLGYITTGVDQIPTKNEHGVIVPTDYYDSLLLLNYSTPLSRFFHYGRNIFVGLNYKLFNRGYSGGINEYATGQSIDVGVRVLPTPYFYLGLVKSNILPVALGGLLRYTTGVEESLTGQTKIGLAAKPVNFNGKLLLASDIKIPDLSTRPSTLHFGAEYKLTSNVTIRGGYEQSIDTSNVQRTSWNPAFGLSLALASFRIDFAYHPYYNDPELATHYLSLVYIGEPVLALKGGPSSQPRRLERRGH